MDNNFINNNIEIRLSGSGGQGLILAGIILAEAAILDGKNVVQTQSYGPEARGGSSKAEVIISNGEIEYPKVREADILLALTEDAYESYKNAVKKNGLIILDSSIKNYDKLDNRILRVSVIETAYNDLKRPMVVNIISLGVIAKVTSVVSKESLIEAIKRKVPKDTVTVNIDAFEKGYNLPVKTDK